MGSLVATPSLLSKVIESQGQDTEVVSIRDRVRSGMGDEGWAIHTDGSLRQITSTYQLIIRSLEPSPSTVPFDSCHSRVIRNQQNLFPIFFLLP